MQLNVIEQMQSASTSMSQDSFQVAYAALRQAGNLAREALQRSSEKEMSKIVQLLKSSKPISDEQISLIREWIVGDAKSYLQAENNYQEWLDEYLRLQGELSAYQERGQLSREEIYELQGILEDATRVNHDIINFLEKKERIDNFESNVTDGLKMGDRAILAQILSAMLASKDF